MEWLYVPTPRAQIIGTDAWAEGASTGRGWGSRSHPARSRQAAVRSAGAPPRSRAPSDRFQHDFTEHQPVLREGLRGKARGGTLPPSLRQLPFLCRPGATLPPSSPQRPLRPCHACLPPGLFALERELESLMGQGARPRTFGKDREWGFPLAPKELKHLGPLCHCLSICAPPAPASQQKSHTVRDTRACTVPSAGVGAG